MGANMRKTQGAQLLECCYAILNVTDGEGKKGGDIVKTGKGCDW